MPQSISAIQAKMISTCAGCRALLAEAVEDLEADQIGSARIKIDAATKAARELGILIEQAREEAEA